MRWQHPTRGPVPPRVLIPIAEKSDLIFELGDFALSAAAAEAGSWGRSGAQISPPFAAVNLSARQFHDPNLLSMIDEALEASGLAPQRLVLEITESAALADVYAEVTPAKLTNPSLEQLVRDRCALLA